MPVVFATIPVMLIALGGALGPLVWAFHHEHRLECSCACHLHDPEELSAS